MRYVLGIAVMMGLLAGSAAWARTDLPLPRFVSVRSSEANVRTGPGLRYQIKWVLVREGLPVEVIAEFENWRKIRDIEGDEGWVHRSMLSNDRTVVVVHGRHTLHKSPYADAEPVAFLEQGVNGRLQGCDGAWCKVKVARYKGWLPREVLWGVYEEE